MTVSDYALIVALIGFALDLIAAVTFDGLDKLVGNTRDNAGVVGGVTCVIKVVLKEDLITDFRIAVKATCRLVILQRKAAPCTVVTSLTFKIFCFFLVLTAKLIKAPINKLVTPVKALFVAVIITCFVQIP